MNNTKKPSQYSLSIDPELKAQIDEAIQLEEEMKALDQSDIRWTNTLDQLKYLREEIGMMIIWEFQHLPF